MTLPKFTTEETAAMYGVSVQRIKDQYLTNAQGLEEMYKKAVKTGKKVNGYTAEELDKATAQYYKLAL